MPKHGSRRCGSSASGGSRDAKKGGSDRRKPSKSPAGSSPRGAKKKADKGRRASSGSPRDRGRDRSRSAKGRRGRSHSAKAGRSRSRSAKAARTRVLRSPAAKEETKVAKVLRSPSARSRRDRSARGRGANKDRRRSHGRERSKGRRRSRSQSRDRRRASDSDKLREKLRSRSRSRAKDKAATKGKAKERVGDKSGRSDSGDWREKVKRQAQKKHAASEKKAKKATKDKTSEATEKADGESPKNQPDSAPKAREKETVPEDKPATVALKVEKPVRPGLGDLAELQRGLEKERGMLQMFVLKAKQEHEEQRETKEKKDRREKEYFKADFGEPCGPKNQLLLEDELGKGVFSTVFKCRDCGVSGKEFAIKFIRANPMLRKATEKEIRLMRRLRNEASSQDPEGARCFLSLAGPETFEHNGHLALVFHLQRCDMRTGLQKYGQGHGLPLGLVRSYARDIFMALRALRKVNVIHSDVKPDNLLMSLDKASVRLSDFGSAMEAGETLRTDYVQPRYYRAPEVVLGQAYTGQVDVWSAGATVFELVTGRFLFTGKTNNSMIHQMLLTCGAFQKSLATSGDFAGKHFNEKGEFKLKDQAGEQLLPMERFVKPTQSINQQLVDISKKAPQGVDAAAHQAAVRIFGDLVARCTVPDPALRHTPEMVLVHRFFQQ